MTDRITQALARTFEEHRLVFWYDEARDMRETFDALDLPGISKLELANNEFGLKVRVLRQEPDQKFLIYREGQRPEDRDNWLLDLELSHQVFKADQAAMWLSELGLPAQFEAVVRDHMEFFKAKSRLDALKARLKPDDLPTRIRLHMLAVCAGADGGLDTVIEKLLAELADETDKVWQLIGRVGLTAFFWKQVASAYGYEKDTPDLEDFTITLFKSCFAQGIGEDGTLNNEALLLFRRWKNDRHGSKAFEALSGRYATLLNIREELQKHELTAFSSIDHFEEIDRELIRRIVHGLAVQTLTAGDVLQWVRERRQSHWYDTYKHIYQAIEAATLFQQALSEASLTMTSAQDGFRRYSESWFRIDQLYRQFIFHMQKSAYTSLLKELFTSIENRYTTNYLLRLNDLWQDQINKLSGWSIEGVDRQSEFYNDRVAFFRRKDQKAVVIISDALRFEAAEECLTRIRSLDRFDAELQPMLSALPSYTQLGMAALLPHKTLAFSDDGNGLIESDGQSTQGLVNREKVLARGRDGDRVKALKFDDIMAMRADEGKELFRDHDVVYVYHNRIDAAGDKLATEDQLPEAVEGALDDLVKLVRKLTSANFKNILITADHGFIYQHRALEDSDFSVAEVTGETVEVRNRRFVLGSGLQETSGLRKYTSADLGLGGDREALIPNSINRLRVKGAGSKFVHGGASLQEVVVPVLKVGKRRSTDVSQVEVQIIASGKSVITTGQIPIAFYQKDPMSEKTQARTLRAGFYAKDDTPISDEHDLVFEYRSENAREREMPRKFLLSREADRFNNQEVFLKLKERVGNTDYYQDYAVQRFQLRRGMETDFDF
jgi:uncharacterized protein (TIGR02687 family)